MMHPFQHRHSTILRRNGISVGVFIARIVLGSPEQRRHSLLLHPLAILALSAADLGQYAKNEMKEDAKEESSTGEDRNGNVLDGFRQSCQDLGRLGGAHGCSNDVCGGLVWVFSRFSPKATWLHVEGVEGVEGAATATNIPRRRHFNQNEIGRRRGRARPIFLYLSVCTLDRFIARLCVPRSKPLAVFISRDITC